MILTYIFLSNSLFPYPGFKISGLIPEENYLQFFENEISHRL
ncbi:hypothetical protein M8C21_006602 [Ambrosia artemisiifolia]|uniref:Uncharacterized protein n=1 Tax=Ambrosia artemisiifolia TaxID=4212 RepID=A0AAD5BMD7_AMBAR|nr:hypothetical protein M8C21_006602 [Ambrosia artemisiifolia]